MENYPPVTIATRVKWYHIAENFRGRKTFADFAVLELSAKVFSAKFWGRGVLGVGIKPTCLNLLKSLSCLCSNTSSLVIRRYQRLMVRFHRLYLRLVLQLRTRWWNKSSTNPTSQGRNGSVERTSTSLPRSCWQGRTCPTAASQPPCTCGSLQRPSQQCSCSSCQIISDHTHTQLAAWRMQPATNPRKFSLQNFIFPNPRRFSPSKVFRDTVCIHVNFRLSAHELVTPNINVCHILDYHLAPCFPSSVIPHYYIGTYIILNLTPQPAWLVSLLAWQWVNIEGRGESFDSSRHERCAVLFRCKHKWRSNMHSIYIHC